MDPQQSQQDADRGQRWLARWRRIELSVAILLIAAGFAAVAAGWIRAADTIDVRIQLQAFLSGGFGGLGLIVLGAALVQSHMSVSTLGGVRDRLDRVADALLEIAGEIRGGDWRGDDTSEIWARPAGDEELVLASHASYHAPGCDLATRRENLREIPRAEAERSALRPCGVCMRVVGALA